MYRYEGQFLLFGNNQEFMLKSSFTEIMMKIELHSRDTFENLKRFTEISFV